MKANIASISFMFFAISTQALGQGAVQQQQQQQFQAEQTRLGYEQQQAQQQSQARAPRVLFAPPTRYMHSAFAATPSGKGWGIGFSARTDIDAKENAVTECEKNAGDEKCLTQMSGDSLPKAAVASYRTEGNPGEVSEWFYGCSETSADEALSQAMSACLKNPHSNAAHRCVPVVAWNAPPMPGSR